MIRDSLCEHRRGILKGLNADMKQMKKLLAVLLLMVMLVSMTSCSPTVGKWIARSEHAEVPVGVYLVYENLYYQQAFYYVDDYTKSPLKQEVELEDKTTMTGAEWIKKNALDVITNSAAVYSECIRLGVTLTEAERELLEDEAATAWESNADAYELIGVGQNSLEYMYEYNKLSDKLFDHIYGEKGTTPVTKEELVKHFEEKYDSVDYFMVSLKDADGNKLSKADQNAIEDELEVLAAQLNSGSVKFEDVVAQYNKAHEKATVTATNRIGQLDSVFTSTIATQLKKCAQGEAVVLEYSDYMYLMFRNKISDKTEEYLKENGDALRHELKDEDYTKYLEDVEKKVVLEINDAAVKKYSPKWMENRVN